MLSKCCTQSVSKFGKPSSGHRTGKSQSSIPKKGSTKECSNHWIPTERSDADAEGPVLWSPDANNQLTGKVLNAGKDWGQKEKRASEDEIAGCHHQCNGHELGHSLGDGDGQGGLMCCSLWGHTELNTTRRLNNSLSEHTAVQMYTHKIWTVWKSKKIH